MDKALKVYLAISAVILFSIILRYLAYLYEKPNTNTPIKEVYQEDPLLLSAKMRAKENLDTLWKLYPNYTENTFVKYPSDSQKNLIDYSWARVLEIQDSELKVLQHESGETISVPKSQIQDWLIELENNNVKGAYTSQALFIIEARKNKQTATKLDSLLNHFVDPLY